jgi:hypothetical protein
MKKIVVVLCYIFLVVGFSTFAMGAPDQCATIQSGLLTYSLGHHLYGTPFVTGFDPYGYNYQAHMFSGSYANAYLGRDGLPPYEGNDVEYLAANPTAANKWYWPYRSTELIMKWNDAWLSNKDCDGDGLLDRHFGYATYIGSGAWETNHMKDVYPNNGKMCKWVDFVKIIAVPGDATKTAGVWYTASGTEIGPDIWGEFAAIEEVYNDPCAGFHGKLYVSPDHPGLGGW